MRGNIGRRQLLKQGGLGLGAARAALAEHSANGPSWSVAAQRPMNVLVVISDQHQAACVGSEGHPQVITPNMDRLAGQGVRFSANYAQSPICTPSRVSVFSGQYCHNHGYFGLSGPCPHLDLPSFLSHFRKHGYRTAALGKVHMPDDPENWLATHCDLLSECYDYHRPPWIGGRYLTYLQSQGLLDKEDSIALREFPGVQQQEGRPSNLPFQHSVEGWCVSEAIRFIDEGGERPFCLEVSLPKPHQCYTPDRRFWEMYPGDLPLPATIYNSPASRPPHFQAEAERLKHIEWLIEPKTFEAGCRRVWRGYLACITQVDYALGLLLDHLEKTGRAGNTIVLYTADHGAYSGAFGIPEKAPGICSELVCRVPSIWRVPGVAKAGHVSSQLVENVDIAPTLAGLCGLPPMDTTDGLDRAELLRGSDRPIREVAITENPWSKSLRWGPWRLVHYQREMFGRDVGELYNIEEDPNETRNLYYDAAQQPVVNEARRLLLEWLIRTTRIVTAFPGPRKAPARYYRVVEDGKESNTDGPAERRRRGALNYI